MEKKYNTVSILKLPNELITLILVNTKLQDIINFGSTCKQFQEIVFNNDFLWKKKYSEIIPNNVVEVVSKHGIGNWLKETINFFELKKTICTELLSMPAKYYWKTKDVSIEDVELFFANVTNSNFNYYYMIHVLQEIVKTGNTLFAKNQCSKPLYTLTTVHYAKIVLRYLIHTFLAMKWFQKQKRHELTPVFVTSFFVQWVDVTNIYKDEDVEQKIQWIIKQVKEVLEKSFLKAHKIHPPEGQKYGEREILNAISSIIYSNSKVYETPTTKTLNLVKVVEDKTGNVISYGALYQAVAKSFQLKCELIAFPNHLFLEWKSDDEPNSPTYTINLFNGEIKPKRSCPYSHGTPRNNEYCPDGLLQFVYSSYIKAKGSVKTSKTINAIHLWDFIGASYTVHSPYKNFFIYLVSHAKSPAIRNTLSMHSLDNNQQKLMLVMSRLNYSPEGTKRDVVIKKRHPTVKYAVGMICYHKIYNYMCVIRGWEVVGSHLPAQSCQSLQYGRDQPFYNVIAGDQSERFIAQENLKLVYTPLRLHSLEDALAKEFSHFDGFAYVPNDEKVVEYPDDNQYIEAFKKNVPI